MQTNELERDEDDESDNDFKVGTKDTEEKPIKDIVVLTIYH